MLTCIYIVGFLVVTKGMLEPPPQTEVHDITLCTADGGFSCGTYHQGGSRRARANSEMVRFEDALQPHKRLQTVREAAPQQRDHPTRLKGVGARFFPRYEPSDERIMSPFWG